MRFGIITAPDTTLKAAIDRVISLVDEIKNKKNKHLRFLDGELIVRYSKVLEELKSTVYKIECIEDLLYLFTAIDRLDKAISDFKIIVNEIKDLWSNSNSCHISQNDINECYEYLKKSEINVSDQTITNSLFFFYHRECINQVTNNNIEVIRGIHREVIDTLLKKAAMQPSFFLKLLKEGYKEWAEIIGDEIERDIHLEINRLKKNRSERLTLELWGDFLEKDEEASRLVLETIGGKIPDRGMFAHFSEVEFDCLESINNGYVIYILGHYLIDGKLFDWNASGLVSDLLGNLDLDCIEYFYYRIYRFNYIQMKIYPELKNNVNDVENACSEDSEYIIGVERCWNDTGITNNSINNHPASETHPELFSDLAKHYWEQLLKYKFVGNDKMLLHSTTRQQTAYIAERFAEKLHIKKKWKVFETFWGISNLAQEKNKRQNETGKMPSRYQDIDTIFSD